MLKRPFLALVLASAGLHGVTSAQSVGQPGGLASPCSNVVGVASITSTTDDGMTWATNRRRLQLGQTSVGIAALETGNWLTEFQGTLYRSGDGCRWTRLAPAPTSLLRMAAGNGDEALAWEFIPGRNIWRIHADGGRRDAVELLATLPTDVLTVSADGADPAHLRAVGRNGLLYDSTDGGMRWGPVGTVAPVTGLTYFASVDPNDVDHVVIGMVLGGTVVSFDGGASWTTSTGFSPSGGSVNGFNGVVSPADGDVVYVMALDLDQSSSGHPSNGRHVFRSDDGGLTFAPVVDQGNGIVLINGPVMEPHPTDADVLYFPFGSRFAGGCNLYRYDHATGGTLTNFTTDFVQIRALAVDPANPDRVVAGLEG